jgi:RNA polymerase sigma factor (sigma-70 family)
MTTTEKNERIVANMDLVPLVVKRFSPSGMDASDLAQEGNLALVEAAGEHTGSQDNFRSFAYSRVYTRIREAANKLGREKDVRACKYDDKFYVHGKSAYSIYDEVDKDTLLLELVTDSESDDFYQVEAADVVVGYLKCLNPREAFIIEKRFGLSGGYVMTLQEVGDEIGRSKETVRQLELRALRKIRREVFLDRNRS